MMHLNVYIYWLSILFESTSPLHGPGPSAVQTSVANVSSQETRLRKFGVDLYISGRCQTLSGGDCIIEHKPQRSLARAEFFFIISQKCAYRIFFYVIATIFFFFIFNFHFFISFFDRSTLYQYKYVHKEYRETGQSIPYRAYHSIPGNTTLIRITTLCKFR